MAVERITNELVDYLLEEDIVSYLLENSHTVPEASKIITPSAFTDSLFSASYSACVELSIDGKVFNRYDVFRLLKTKEKELGIDASQVLSMLPKRPLEITKVCSDLKEIENKRILSEISLKIQKGITNGSTSSELTSIVDANLERITSGAISSEVENISDIYERVMDKMSATAGVLKFSGIETGSRKLNYALGGWQEGMIVIAARPGMGKTIVGLEHAKEAAKAKARVLFLSLEMPTDSLMYRYISSEVTEYNYSDLKANRITQEDVTKILNSNAKLLKQLPIYFYDSDNRDINYLSMVLTSEVRKNKIDIVVIDYMQLIRDNQIKDQSDFAQVSSVSNKIQKLTKKLHIPILCLSQLSRDIEKRTNRQPQLADLRSSGNIEQDAIVVIGLYRDDYYKYTDAKTTGQAIPPMDNTLKYCILKNRDGEVGDVGRFVDVKTNRVADSEDELFRFETPQLAFQSSKINEIKHNFDNVTIQPF